ncbi:hypothetical protein FS837_004010 [Tulasnella sp. UAMH 9824]|nr:hypothetical protein FS837_004010 [Tulasnella sp. UAMH 9824]
MAARQSVTGHSTGTSSSYGPSSSDSSTHSNPPPSAAVRSLRQLSNAQIPSSSRVRPSTASSAAWAPTFSVSDSQMLNEHTVMSAEGFVAIPKSPITETSTNMTSIASAVAAGKEKKEKEKGKKRAKVFALGRLMVKEVLGGGGNAASGQPCYPSTVPVDGPYTSRRRSMSASDINRLAEDAMREGDPYGQHLQPQHQVYGNPLMAPSHLAPLSAEHLDSFVPPVQRKHSMQELQPVRGPRPRPSALSFGGASAAAGRPLVPNVVIDHGTPLVEEPEARFASPPPTSPPVTRDTTLNKRTSRPLPKVNARGGASGAAGNEDDTEWVLSESVTVVGFPTTQSSDSFQFDTKEGVKRSTSSLGTASPAPTSTSTTSSKRESRSGAARPPAVEVQVVREEWSSVPEEDEEDTEEVEHEEDATPRVQGVVPKASLAATAVHPSAAPYAPAQQQAVSREFPVQPFPPPYGAPLPQMQPYMQQTSLPQMQDRKR